MESEGRITGRWQATREAMVSSRVQILQEKDSSMHDTRSFTRDYTRMVVVVAIPLVGLLVAKLVWNVLPTEHYLPHHVSFGGEALLLWTHVLTDLGIGLSYVAIGITLASLIVKARRDLPYHPVFIAFGAFITACGATHLMHVWTVWMPNYWIEGYIKGITLLASLATAVALPPLVPRILDLIRAARLSEQRAAELRSRDEFLSVAAHEFKTPITAISGYVQVLERRAMPALAARDWRAIRVIGEQAARLQRLVDELLDLSRVELGRFVIERVPLDLARLTAAVVDDLRPMMERHELHLRDTGAAPLVVRGDAGRLQQMLHNLLANAITYSPHGGAIEVRLAREVGWAVVAITDHGIGIPVAAQPHVWERFFRASNVDHHGILDGFGIGLYVVKEIVERHDGTVALTSAEGVGSTFTVHLPLVPDDDGAAPGQPAVETPGDHTPKRQSSMPSSG
jgi:signal transduction histidine kinase